MKAEEQRKLGSQERRAIETIVKALPEIPWEQLSEGTSFWAQVHAALNMKAIHGTTNGKPYVEPERWRVPTDEDATQRPQCRVRDCKFEQWKQATLYVVDDMQQDEETTFLAKDEEDGFWWYSYCEILDNETKTE